MCVAILLQMVAELEILGTITGSAEMSASADFEVNSRRFIIIFITIILLLIREKELRGVRIEIQTSGKADVDVGSPRVSHQAGFGLAASATAMLRLSFGPELTVWPMPGAPVSVTPMLNAELRGSGPRITAASPESSKIGINRRRNSDLRRFEDIFRGL